MWHGKSVQEVETDQPELYGFRITGEVDREDMRQMPERMLAAFDRHDKVGMLLVFETDETSTFGWSWSSDGIKAQFQSLSKLRTYVVAIASDRAGGNVETLGSVMPVEARRFDSEDAARAWLREQPPLVA